MNQYIHHVPGRVRIKSPMFKNNLEMLDLVRNHFESGGKIEYITANPLTGSVVINYDPKVIAPDAILQILKD